MIIQIVRNNVNISNILRLKITEATQNEVKNIVEYF